MNHENQFVKRCFDNLVRVKPWVLKKENIIHGDILDIPSEMFSGDGSWRLIESTVSDEELDALERKFHITLPSLYREFLSVYFHVFERLTGIFDDYYDEDNVEVGVDIFPQLVDNPLGIIEDVFCQCGSLLDCGYIPIGDLRGYGPLCIDTWDENKIVWFDHDEYYECESREEFEEQSVLIFDNFSQFLECFFCGMRHRVGN